MTSKNINDIPDKNGRPRAWEYHPQRFQWRIGRTSDQVIINGSSETTPFTKSAVFVVHGIGDQEDTDTAASMRWGIEDALPLVELKNWDPTENNAWILPAPYINDGY